MRKVKKMKPDWMNKDYWKYYCLRILLFIILLIGIKSYKLTHPKNPVIISTLDIKEGNFVLFTNEKKECGNISIQRINENDIIITLKGDEIIGKNVINKPYKLKPVVYENFYMKPKTVNNETFYLYDTGETYIVLLKIRKEKYYFIDNYDNKKNVDLYLVSEMNYKNYDFMIDYSYKRELQEDACVSIDSNRYTCFFEQENNQEHVKKTFNIFRMNSYGYKKR